MAYTAVVSSPLSGVVTIGPGIGMYSGRCNVTDYDSGTLLEITAITRHFKAGGQSGYTKGIIAVIPSGASDKGNTFGWDYTTGAFKAYYPSTLVISGSASGKAVTFTGTLLAAASTVGAYASVAAEEVSSAADVGEVGFYAIGFI